MRTYGRRAAAPTAAGGVPPSAAVSTAVAHPSAPTGGGDLWDDAPPLPGHSVERRGATSSSGEGASTSAPLLHSPGGSCGANAPDLHASGPSAAAAHASGGDVCGKSQGLSVGEGVASPVASKLPPSPQPSDASLLSPLAPAPRSTAPPSGQAGLATIAPWWRRPAAPSAAAAGGGTLHRRLRLGEGDVGQATLAAAAAPAAGMKRPFVAGGAAGSGRPAAKVPRTPGAAFSAPPGGADRPGWLEPPSAPAATPASASGGRGALVQTYLDAGQRGVDTRTCAACGMVWAPGLPQDERDHAAHCASSAGGGDGAARLQLPFAPAKEDAVVAQFTMPAPAGDWGARGGDVPARVVMVRAPADGGGGCAAAPSAAARRGRVWEVRALLARVLGEGSDPEGWGERGGAGAASGAGAAPPPPREVVRWVCVVGGRVAGVAVTQRIATAFPTRVVVASPGGERQLTVDVAAPRPAQLGVAQVWVHPACRRAGVATALLDAARAHAVYAHRVPPAALAFSAPTGAGEALARAYLAAAAAQEGGGGGGGGTGAPPELLVFTSS